LRGAGASAVFGFGGANDTAAFSSAGSGAEGVSN
jgi:hypothetical protein